MENHVALIDQLSRDRLVVNVFNRVVKARMVLQVTNVLDAAGRQIVDDKDFVAALQVRVGKMRADKAGAPSD